MTEFRMQLLSGAAVFAALAVLGSPVNAQQAVESGTRVSAIEEVVVTARRREENLQDVPAAVTALSGEALAQQQIRTPTDVQIVTPSLSIGGANSNFSRNMGNYSIRGVGQGLFGGSSVTSYFSEAPFGPTGPAMPFFDIESVQVLKGPQGTLFGRATAGGAVLIQPRRATTDAIYGMAQARIGNRGRADFDAMLNLPVVEDKLAVRLAVNRTHIDGYVDNLSTGQKMDENSSYSIRGSMTFRPVDAISNDLVYNYYNFEATTAGRIVVGANLGLANLNRTAANFTAVCNSAVGFGLATDIASCQAQRVGILANIRSALSAEVARSARGGDSLRTITTGNAYANMEFVERHDTVNTTRIDLPAVGAFRFGIKNILSIQYSRSLVEGNFSGTPFDLNASAFGTSSQAQWVNGKVRANTGAYNEVLTNEFQLNGSFDENAVIWILGYYYQNAPVTVGLQGSTNLNRTFGGVGTVNLGPISATSMPLGGFSRETAYFGQFTADLSRIGLNGLSFTAGYRKTETEVVNTTAPAVITYPAGSIAPGSTISTSRTSGEGPGYTVSLDWKANDDLLVYVTHRKGYKPGGLNVIPGASAVPGFVPVFDPESIVDTEIGAKFDFRLGDSGRGRLNVAAFRDDYTNIQRGVNAIPPAGQNIAFTANVAEARIQGFEAEGLLVLGESWTVSGSYSFIESDYRKWFGSDPLGAAPAGANIDLSNNPFANAPRQKASLTVQYVLPTPADLGEMSASLTVFGQDRSWLSDNAQRFIEVYKGNPNVILAEGSIEDAVSDPGFVAANARLDWRGVFGREDLDASVFVKNLTDEIYAYAGGVALQSLGVVQKLYSEPRTFGVELTYRFGAR